MELKRLWKTCKQLVNNNKGTSTRSYNACMDLGGPIRAYADPQGPVRVDEEHKKLDGLITQNYNDLEHFIKTYKDP